MTDTFYENGHDVHLHREDSVVNDNGNPRGTGDAFDDVAEAVSLRGVENVDILGYSHGGGSTYDLAWRIDHTDTATIQFNFVYQCN